MMKPFLRGPGTFRRDHSKKTHMKNSPQSRSIRGGGGVLKIRGLLVGGSQNKDRVILKSRLGFLCLWKLPYYVALCKVQPSSQGMRDWLRLQNPVKIVKSFHGPHMTALVVEVFVGIQPLYTHLDPVIQKGISHTIPRAFLCDPHASLQAESPTLSWLQGHMAAGFFEAGNSI